MYSCSWKPLRSWASAGVVVTCYDSHGKLPEQPCPPPSCSRKRHSHVRTWMAHCPPRRWGVAGADRSLGRSPVPWSTRRLHPSPAARARLRTWQRRLGDRTAEGLLSAPLAEGGAHPASSREDAPLRVRGLRAHTSVPSPADLKCRFYFATGWLSHCQTTERGNRSGAKRSLSGVIISPAPSGE